MRSHITLALFAGLLATSSGDATERTTTVRRDAYACSSWAAWLEYGAASLTPKGARISKLCPIRIAPGTEVVIVEDDAGAGASEIRLRGKNWFVDNDRLD